MWLGQGLGSGMKKEAAGLWEERLSILGQASCSGSVPYGTVSGS